MSQQAMSTRLRLVTVALHLEILLFCLVIYVSVATPAAFAAFHIGNITIARACAGSLIWPPACLLILVIAGWSLARFQRDRAKPSYWMIALALCIAYGISALVTAIAWGFGLKQALYAGIAVPGATQAGPFIALVLLSPYLLVNALRRWPRWCVNRRIRRTVLAMTTEDALKEVEWMLSATSRFEVTESDGTPVTMPPEAGPELRALLGRWAEIRIPYNGFVIRGNAVRRSEQFPQTCVLLLAPPYEDGPVWVCDIARGVEVFDDVDSLMKGIPWGGGWPSLAHFLIYMAKKEVARLGIAPDHWLDHHAAPQ